MKKLLANLSVILAAAAMLTACAGNHAADSASTGMPAATPGPVQAESTPAPTEAPTPTPEPEPMVLARVETHPASKAGMEGGVVLRDTWTEKRYSPEGLLLEELSGPVDGTADTMVEYSYDDRGYLVRETHSYLTDGVWQMESDNEYTNDDYGNVLTWITTNSAGFQTEQTYTYEYDEKGRWTRRGQNDPAFPMWSIREYSGDGMACTEYLYYSGEKLRMISTYDDAGHLLREDDVDNGETGGFREYTYDDQGGLICVTTDYPDDELPVMDMWEYTNEYAPLSQVLADDQ